MLFQIFDDSSKKGLAIDHVSDRLINKKQTFKEQNYILLGERLLFSSLV